MGLVKRFYQSSILSSVGIGNSIMYLLDVKIWKLLFIYVKENWPRFDDDPLSI